MLHFCYLKKIVDIRQKSYRLHLNNLKFAIIKYDFILYDALLFLDQTADK